jgi:Protein of unknown function (DUF3995)
MEKVTSVHSRTLAAAPDEVGALLDTIASDQDRLWPTHKWPATPIRFDRPLAVGADGGHGMIRYRVSAYEPGRRVAFTFTPGGGLEGTHELRVEPADASRTTLTHELAVTPAWWMRPVAPLLLRAHDALIEDLLDCAQLATDGRVEQPARWPRWLKLANAAEALLLRRGAPDRTARIAGGGVPAILAALAALHAAWALGSPWPAGSRAELAEAVLSSSEGMPPDWATWAVAGLLALAAVVVRRAAAGEQHARVLTAGIAAAFGARAVAYLPSDLAGGLATTYQRFDLALYAPLCMLIGAGAAAIVRRHGAARTPLPA